VASSVPCNRVWPFILPPELTDNVPSSALSNARRVPAMAGERVFRTGPHINTTHALEMSTAARNVIAVKLVDVNTEQAHSAPSVKLL
jgi:hypothetical protein